jgi:4-alpha-glucanotransferase
VTRAHSLFAEGRRAAGILLHPTSLPGRYGIGDLGDELTSFLDWAAGAGQTVWQVLPLNPTGYGNSPYGCLSSFAGNPLLISPQRLLQENLLSAEAVADVPQFPTGHVDFEAVGAFKARLLRASFAHFRETASELLRNAYDEFLAHDDQAEWLDDWALYMSLKEQNGGRAWSQWDEACKLREPHAINAARTSLAEELEYHKYVQFLFFRQWAAVREAAHERGIQIMGDVPIYVAGDSADVWASPELFQLDARCEPTVVAGVPPDYFSVTGQRWGNPLYRWDAMHADNYRWYVARIRANLRLADIVRLDHFRGFAAYWEIPASEPTAIEGRWMPGPGKPLFDAIQRALGDLPLVAEDLGFITPEVHELRRAIDVPGMRVLQFAFAQIDSIHLPHHYEAQTVVYTGTHDNDTARGWFTAAGHDERNLAQSYLGTSGDDIAWSLIRVAYCSVARLAIVPLQDVLDLPSSARMNRPGDGSNNWGWRYAGGATTHDHATALRKLVEITGRLG